MLAALVIIAGSESLPLPDDCVSMLGVPFWYVIFDNNRA